MNGIANAAGLSAIRYRLGDFASFREAMSAAIPAADLLAGGVTSLQSVLSASDSVLSVIDSSPFPAFAPFQVKIDTEYLQVINCLTPTTWAVARGPAAASHGLDSQVLLVPPNPFEGWHEGIHADYQTMLVELWAYVADILTFYQERIANEAFLGTATLRDSLVRLAGLIDYHPTPGAGAGGWVGFTVAPKQSVTIPAGFRVASRPQPGQSPVVFETTNSIIATADNNAIPFARLSRSVPFAPETVVLPGANPGVAVGDYLLIVDVVERNSKSANLVRVNSVVPDTRTGMTTIGWKDPRDLYHQASKQATVYAFRVKAAPFGYNAPLWDVLSPTLTNSNQQFPGSLYAVSWEVRSFERRNLAGLEGAEPSDLVLNEWFFIPVPGEHPDQLFLDRVYSQLQYDSSNPGLAVLLTDDGVFQILGVTEAREAAKTAYSIAAQSTRLTFDQPITPQAFPLRATSVLTGNELLPLQLDLPLPDPLTGAALTLAGSHAQLQDGQTVVVRGSLFDVPQTTAAEAAILDGAPQIDTVNGVTVVNLKQGLTNRYVRSTCTLVANVAEITQGETVNDEILGSGNGDEFQSLPLKKTPLTYLPSTDPEGLSAVASTLTVSVNGVAWVEQPSLAASSPGDTVYITTVDDSGQTTVVFGDGITGARPPTGVDNIHAHYRKGLGAAGNLTSGSVQQLLDSLTNLQRAANPIPTSGGADPESPGSIRKSAPATLRTFGRAVSAADYAALAAGYPGIAKASAAWIVQDLASGRVLPHPYVQVTAATLNRTPLLGTSLAVNLRRYLDNHRDPNLLLRIQDFTPVYIAVTAEISIDPLFPHQGTIHAVNAALNPGVNPDGSLGFFAFDRLQFGESISLSALYAAIQAVPGVDNVVVTSLARVSPNADAVFATPQDITVGPTEVAVIDSDAVPASVLIVTGKGGFAGL